MRIAIVGGIYGKGAGYRATVQATPEQILEAGLRDLGHDVVTYSHSSLVRLSGVDVLHVHHATKAALPMLYGATCPTVFTPHAFVTRTGTQRWLTERCINLAHRVVCLSAEEERLYVDRCKEAAPKLAVIANGVDTGAFPFAPQEPPRPGDPWRLLFVGQLAEVKRPGLLLEALGLLLARYQVELRYVFHTDSLQRALADQATRMGIQDHVTFVGPRRGQELWKEYKDSHMLVLPSSHECLPSVVTEALLVGRPVVATDVGGVSGQGGTCVRLVSATAGASELAEGIEDVISHFDDFAARSASRRDSLAVRFDPRRAVRRHVELYEQVILERPRPPAPTSLAAIARRLPSLARINALRREARA